MAFFGGTGIKGKRLHPSLKTYLDCFLSSPFPKMYPRGGGVWDQDPVLMQHFRIIRKFDEDWKESQQNIENAKQNVGFGGQEQGQKGGGGVAGIGNALNAYIDSLEDNGSY